MRYSLLRTFSMNLGDEIQNLAARRFLPRVDDHVDRERWHEAAGRPDSFLIANGWFLHRPERFPPPPNLRPFYISLHVDGPGVLSPAAVAHLKAHAPIGCRDRYTLDLLRGLGVAAYLSGCLTWTLEPRGAGRGDEVLMVDVPAGLEAAVPEALRRVAVRLTHTCYAGLSRDYHPSRRPLSRFDLATLGAEVGLRRALGWGPLGRRRGPADRDAISAWRLSRAQALLDRYATARLVITSRIHAYFPCLAFGTPVVLLRPDGVYAPQRYSFELTGAPARPEPGPAAIDWAPQPLDLSAPRRVLTRLCERAVAIGDNPLRHTPVDLDAPLADWAID